MISKSMRDEMIFLLLALFLFVFSACGGGSAVKSEPAATKDSPAATSAAGSKEEPLGKKYTRIVFQKFEYDPQIETDYPGAVAECEKSALEAVMAKKIFASAVRETTDLKHKDALLVKAKVKSLRIVSTAARMWGGAFAGSSEMSLQMRLIDASSGAVVREKELSTNNNPWAASWTGGSSDRSLPTDLGRMVAEYLDSIQPQGDKITDLTPITADKKMTESGTSRTSGKQITEPSPSKEVEAIKTEAKSIQAPSENLSPTPQAVKTLVIIKNASIRSAPSTKSRILATLKKGAKVELLGKSGNWFNVKLSTGAIGWVFNTLVTEQK